MPIPLETVVAATLALCALGFLVWTEWKHTIDSERKDKLIADLMDRLMSRDVAEYKAVVAESAPRTGAPEYFDNEADNIMGFQMMGEDWKSPERWMKDYAEGIEKEGKDGG